MIEQNSITGIDSIGLAIVANNPIGIELRDRIGASWMKGCRLCLRGFDDFPIEFRRRRLVESRLLLKVQRPNDLEESERSQCVDICSVLRLSERGMNMRLGCEIVDFNPIVRGYILEQLAK
jgi:hypothetical protein